MKIIKLSCPNCGASLNSDMDNMILHCPYCRQKLQYDMDIDNFISEKESTKREQEKTERLKTVFNFLENRRVMKQQERIEQYKALLYLVPLIIVVMIAMSITSCIALH